MIDDKLQLLKELRNTTLDKILEKHGDVGYNLNEIKLSILDVKEVLYKEAKKIAERENLKDFNKEWAE